MNTNGIIVAVREHNDIGFSTAPLIFISTVISHFFGGSAGREGAALQLGGSIGYNLGKLFKCLYYRFILRTCGGIVCVIP